MRFLLSKTPRFSTLMMTVRAAGDGGGGDGGGDGDVEWMVDCFQSFYKYVHKDE